MNHRVPFGMRWLYHAERRSSAWRPRVVAAIVFAGLLLPAQTAHAVDLEDGFDQPPPKARLRAFWWWLNGNVTEQAITADLEAMKAKGFGGALLCDAGGAEQRDNAPVPHGPDFASPAWRALYRHALREAARLGLELSLNIQSGWNLGGPVVRAEDAAKKLTWAETEAHGPSTVHVVLPKPPANDGFYRDVRVLAWPVRAAENERRSPLKNYEAKALIATPPMPGILANSAPDTAPIFADEHVGTPGEEDTTTDAVVDLTGRLAADGALTWDVPAGHWRILRVGATLCDRRFVSTSSDGWKGYALDVLDRAAFQRYWDAVVAPLIADAGPLAGTTLRYLHTDSWEVDAFNWTPSALEEFRARRGYDATRWLPVLSGRIVNSRESSNRFLEDFRRTLGDLAADNHYRPFQALAARHGLGIHPEAGGPHFTPIDAQQCLAIGDVPMGEFWAESPRHRTTDEVRFFVKQPASAAHTAGRQLVSAEGFTNIGLHWQERLWENLKPAFDQACVEGLNRLVWHAFVCSPAAMGIPGQQFFAGTHLNPHVTWWDISAAFFTYLNRCQFMLQRGLPVADLLYYYGSDVPNFARLRKSDPARAGNGYDYDVIALEQLLTRVAVKNGHLVLPDGMSYRALVLPDQRAIAPAALQKVSELVAAGATVIGPKPARAMGLGGLPNSDAGVRRLADETWRRVISDRPAATVLRELGAEPDFEFAARSGESRVSFVHRREGETDIYFVANRARNVIAGTATFRTAGRAPELWDPVTGTRRFATHYRLAESRTSLSLELPPCGSLFVVFRSPAERHPSTGASNFPALVPVATLDGTWRVSFDPRWASPAIVELTALTDWTAWPEPDLRHYSGTAIYRTTFDAPVGAAVLDLGDVRELARVRVNGREFGTVWAPPFRIDVGAALRPTANDLEIEVANFWANRVIGDAALPAAQRRTRTNIRNLTADTPLMPSGLLGPVRLLAPVVD